VGVYRRHAQLDGIWRDVVIVEHSLPPQNQLKEGAAPATPSSSNPEDPRIR
jgi:hypothetical protein